jgi:hypothetical protein
VAGGLGWNICSFFHFCRFTKSAEEKRVLRPNSDYYILSTLGCLFYPVWSLIQWVLYEPLKLSVRVITVVKSPVAKFFAIMFSPIILSLAAVVGASFWLIMVLFFQMYSIWAGICTF